MPNIVRAFLVVLLPLLLSACASSRLLTSDDRVNVAVGDMNEVTARFETIKGMLEQGKAVDRKTALSTLGIPNEKEATIENLRRPDIQAYMFGTGATLMSDSKVLELLDHLSGVRIPFTERKVHITLSGGVYINTYETGYDFALVLIFRDGLIRNADQIGVISINRTSKSIIWNPASGIGHAANNAILGR